MKQTNPEMIVLTGASRGIGRATALKLAGPGRHLILVARSRHELDSLRGEVEARGSDAETHVVDLAEENQVESFAELIAAREVEFLVLNAGVSLNRPFLETSARERARETRLNYLTPCRLIQAVLPGMRNRARGRIIATGSLTAIVPFPGNASYAGSKAALLGFLRSLQIEIRNYGISITSILPGLVNTELTRELSAPLMSMVPMQEPEEVADEVLRNLRSGPPIVIPGPANFLLGSFFQAFPDPGSRLLEVLGPLFVPRASRGA